jgi:hypothetical protein
MIALLAAAVYVGSSACTPCHSGIARKYAQASMAQSSGRFRNGVVPGGFRHEASGVEYRMSASGQVSMHRGERSSSRQFRFFIGSSSKGRSYLVEENGFLYQAPVTWYERQKRWDSSPGFERDTVSRWSRPVDPSCLYCHASQSQPVKATLNRYRDPPFLQDGIGCERCHGPGSDHVQGKGKSVNPTKLDPVRRDAVCAQCHLSGEARVEAAGLRIEDYRPGELLSDFVSYFVFEDRRSGLKATSHVEKLSLSRCKQRSGDKLWCGTCHDPHGEPARQDREKWHQARCETCHNNQECRRGPDCASCHMPKATAVDGGHGVLTDHSIPRRAQRVGFAQAAAWKLIPFSGGPPSDRDLGLAYAEVFLRSGDNRQAVRAIGLLENRDLDPPAMVRLAVLYQRMDKPDRALGLYRKVLEADPDNYFALANLAMIVASRGGLVEAVPMWKRALLHNPCSEEIGANLATALRALGEHAEAAALARAQQSCRFP